MPRPADSTRKLILNGCKSYAPLMTDRHTSLQIQRYPEEALPGEKVPRPKDPRLHWPTQARPSNHQRWRDYHYGCPHTNRKWWTVHSLTDAKTTKYEELVEGQNQVLKGVVRSVHHWQRTCTLEMLGIGWKCSILAVLDALEGSLAIWKMKKSQYSNNTIPFLYSLL